MAKRQQERMEKQKQAALRARRADQARARRGRARLAKLVKQINDRRRARQSAHRAVLHQEQEQTVLGMRHRPVEVVLAEEQAAVAIQRELDGASGETIRLRREREAVVQALGGFYAPNYTLEHAVRCVARQANDLATLAHGDRLAPDASNNAEIVQERMEAFQGTLCALENDLTRLRREVPVTQTQAEAHQAEVQALRAAVTTGQGMLRERDRAIQDILEDRERLRQSMAVMVSDLWSLRQQLTKALATANDAA